MQSQQTYPQDPAGAIVAFSDYARNFATYNLTIGTPNGSEKMEATASDPLKLTVNGQAATFVYVDSTKGWVNVQNAEDTELFRYSFYTSNRWNNNNMMEIVKFIHLQVQELLLVTSVISPVCS